MEMQRNNSIMTGLIENIIYQTDKKVKRVYWTNEEIDEWFGKRSVSKIIENGTTCFMNPCSDLSIVSASILNQNKIPYSLSITENLPEKHFDFNRIHFILRLNYQNAPLYIDYKRNNEVYLSREFPEKNSRIIKQVIQIPGEEIDIKKSLQENIKNSSKGKFLKSFSLDKNINRLKKDNSPENYDSFIEHYGNELRIIKQF